MRACMLWERDAIEHLRKWMLQERDAVEHGRNQDAGMDLGDGMQAWTCSGFGHGCYRDRMQSSMNVIRMWAWML